MWYILAGILCVVLILVLIWWFLPAKQKDSNVDQKIPSTHDLSASQNIALATTQTAEDQKLRANTTVSTEVRGYKMPTSRDEQLVMMQGTWATFDGILYVIESIDIAQDRFTMIKKTANPTSIVYTGTGWNNNNLYTIGSDGKTATFVYQGASMVIQTQNISILLIRQTQ